MFHKKTKTISLGSQSLYQTCVCSTYIHVCESHQWRRSWAVRHQDLTFYVPNKNKDLGFVFLVFSCKSNQFQRVVNGISKDNGE